MEYHRYWCLCPTWQHYPRHCPPSPSCHLNLASSDEKTPSPCPSIPTTTSEVLLSPLVPLSRFDLPRSRGQYRRRGRGPPWVSDWFSHTFLANEKFPLPGARPGFFLAPVSLPHLCLRHDRLSHGGPGPPPARWLRPPARCLPGTSSTLSQCLPLRVA